MPQLIIRLVDPNNLNENNYEACIANTDNIAAIPNGAEGAQALAEAMQGGLDILGPWWTANMPPNAEIEAYFGTTNQLMLEDNLIYEAAEGFLIENLTPAGDVLLAALG